MTTDAPRWICDPGPRTTCSSRGPGVAEVHWRLLWERSVTLHRYESLIQLRELWDFDDVEGEQDLAVILVLHPHFAGRLGAIVERRSLGDQLTLSAAGGKFPALPDWSFLIASAALGWKRISVEPAWPTALRRALQSTSCDVLMFWPEWCGDECQVALNEAIAWDSMTSRGNRLSLRSQS